nr:sporulation histidine kinase inhibitor Sda [Salipaludibacillus keqinensis]
MRSLNKLTDDLLLEIYKRAIELELDGQFIQILKDELNKRGLLLKE